MSGLAIPQPPVPVIVLTGFLGSGKTTVLKYLLDHPEADGTAVIVNEFGDVGLDHLLLERGDENTLLLDNGCLCCTVKSDLVTTLQSMLDRAERAELPAFDRVVIETTGLADPGSLIRAFWSDPLAAVALCFLPHCDVYRCRDGAGDARSSWRGTPTGGHGRYVAGDQDRP